VLMEISVGEVLEFIIKCLFISFLITSMAVCFFSWPLLLESIKL
jgi:hypothetical protein